MNLSVLTYYRLADDVIKMSSRLPDVSVPVALRHVWVRGGRDLDKISAALRSPDFDPYVRTLGGVEATFDALRKESDVMRVWDEAEQVGKDLACAHIESMLESGQGGA